METDLYADVRPKGWLLQRLNNIDRYDKWRWNQYLRACRAIPKSSPVHGSTSWDRINARRLQLIGQRADCDEAEFRALQEVAAARKAGPLVASIFLLRRVTRRLKSLNA